jgi:hypothetical protein
LLISLKSEKGRPGWWRQAKLLLTAPECLASEMQFKNLNLGSLIKFPDSHGFLRPLEDSFFAELNPNSTTSYFNTFLLQGNFKVRAGFCAGKICLHKNQLY